MTCPTWCESSHSPADADGHVMQAARAVEVGGIVIAVESVDGERPEVHITGDGDYSPEGARAVAAAILAAADQLAGVLSGDR